MRVGISTKLVIVLALLSVGIFAVIVVTDFTRIRHQFESEFVSNARTVGQALDATVTSVADLENHDQLFTTIQKMVWLNPEILRISVSRPIDGDLRTVMSSDPRRIGAVAGEANARSFGENTSVHSFHDLGDAGGFSLITPIHIARKQWGTFEIEFTLERVEQQTSDRFIKDLMFFAITFLLLSLSLFVSVRLIVIGRLRKLSTEVQEFGLSAKPPTLPLESHDEIGDLARGFRQMTLDLSEAQEKLRQSQRLEAVGQLTGGIAHDFNNLLAVILGSAELISDQKLRSIDDLVGSIRGSAQRGAELTRHLLAFSRKQPLAPRSFDPRALLTDLPILFGRTLGETISIKTRFPADLWDAFADPGQLENALLNLAINARDAMPKGGELAIRCSNARVSGDQAGAEAGDYVVVAVSDSGTGMPPDVLARVFEPFYTTKEVGQGSGLGLSMVYGFAKQSGGHVDIESAPGLGTTVSLYLPRSRSTVEPKGSLDSPALHRGLGEVILVIEDDEDVRAVATRMLRDLNYEVLAAPEVASARRLLETEAVDLVLADITLPGGMSGAAFAEELRDRRPGLKTVLMSGYPAESLEVRSDLAAEWIVLLKPFEKRELARVLRQAMA